MKKGFKKAMLVASVLILALVVGGVSAFADFGSGVAAMAEGTEIIKTAISGKKIVFSDVDFKQGLCITDFDQIEITAVPESNQGTLMLAGRRVGVGTVIKRKNIGALVFIPASRDVSECRFKFKTDDYASGAEVDFVLKFTEKVNYAPTVSEKSDTALVTQREVAVYGRMRADDVEADAVEYLVISYPTAGVLTVSDKKSGEFLYTPPTDYTGEVSFTFVARDEWGNFSRPQKVEISVVERMSEVVYEDLRGHRDYNAAIALTAIGAVDGRLIGDGVYFMPEDKVTVAEFVTMAMKCAGISPDKSLTETYFDDDGDIPAPMKSYIATAQKYGIVQGKFENGGLFLYPNKAITRYEAAMVMAMLVDSCEGATIPTFSDSDTLPVWAEAAVAEMCAMGIFDGECETIGGTDELDKIECAAYLYKMYQSIEG